MNSLKWVVVLSLIVIGVVGNYHYANQSILVRALSLLAIAVIAAAVALRTEKGKQFWTFTQEARAELRKVVWPTRQETIQTTIMVLAVVAIVGLILWVVDLILLKMVAWLTGYGAF